MRDDQLLNDLDTIVKIPSEKYDWLAEKKITTYSQLFAFIQDENNDSQLRWEACYVIHRLWKVVDRRRAVPCLLAALKASDEDVRCAAANALGMIKSNRAVTPLLTILNDKSESVTVRHWVIDGLNLIGDERALPIFWQIIDDPNEHVELRSRAIEEMFENPQPVARIIALFSDPVPDIRFWAAYQLATGYANFSTALSELDRIVAYDHTLPICWGWHVDREAMLPLETIHYNLILGLSSDEDGEYYGRAAMYLISPAPEYSTLEWRYRTINDDWTYANEPLPEIKLRIEPEWLAEKLREKWPEIRLNVREPRPQAYFLDWHLQVGEAHFIGGLHRDQYGVVLSGEAAMIYAFAEWYRGLFPESQHLYFYEWADAHVELKLGMSAAEIERASGRTSMSAVEVQTEDLSFG